MIRAALLALALPATAQAACGRVEAVPEIVACLEGVYAEADRELNETWPRVLAVFPSGGVRSEHEAEIVAAQRAWIAFRDADCAARAKVGIPKYWVANELDCRIKMTRAHTQTLQATYVD